MYSAIHDFDPMILESGLQYPKTLDETVLVAQGKAFQEQEPGSLTKPYGKSNLERQHEGSDSGSPSNSTAAGSDVRAKAIAAGEKKRKRCSKKSSSGGTDGRAKKKAGGEKKRKNWTDEETELLLKVVPQKTKFRSRIDKFSDSEPSWEGIAKELVFERTGDECRRRMDTLIKSYKAIKQYCENQKIEVSHLNENFEDTILAMPKLATRFKGSWYNYVHDYCPPRSNKNFMRKQGAGNSFEKRASSVFLLLLVWIFFLTQRNGETRSRRLIYVNKMEKIR
ncbi:hypothetical protein KC19_10G151300 [Ceratodon purpureus]|uniref:Myb-like domain-containing protein n=1 Tax=Ceratodon purpureus TaxID=3225 RepID=A0A8T0GP64_CERPU|nr:hypothetical protein KC19_10G151300 [Ceratodon purpureus]